MTTKPAWRRSSRCGTNTCVEVAPVESGVLMRDSKNPNQQPLAFTHADWAGFVSNVRTGHLADL